MKKNLLLITTCFVMLFVALGVSRVKAQSVVQTEDFTSTTFVPTGWSLYPAIANPNGAVWSRRTLGTTIPAVPHSAPAMASFRASGGAAGDLQALVTPSFDLSNRGASAANVSFWIYRDSLAAANADELAVWINNTTPDTVGAVFMGNVARCRLINLPDTQLVNGWYQYTFAMPASFTGGVNYILITGTAHQGGRIYMDDVSYDTYPPACSGTPNVGSIVNGSNIICGGGGATSLSLSAPITGLAGLTYQWQSASSSAGPWTNVGTGTDTLNTGNLTATTFYTCTVNCTPTSSTYNTAVDSVIISNNTPPVVTVTGNTTICSGTSSLLVATGALTYTWTPATGLTPLTVAMDSVNAAPTAPINYTVTGTDAAGCTGTAPVNMTVNPLPILNATAYPLTGNTPLSSTTICLGDTIRLNSIPGGGANQWTYLWSDAHVVRIDTVMPTITTTYSVIATITATGCMGYDTIVINVATGAPPVINFSPSAGPLASCNGAPVTITASGALTYSWTPANGLDTTAGATVNAAPNANTVYTVTGLNGGCPGTATITVNRGNSPAVTPILILAGNDTVCTGTQIILRGGPGGGGPGGANTFAWSNGSVTRNDTITPIGSGLYFVTVSTAIGCSTNDSISIVVNAGTAPTLSISPNAPIASCNGNAVTITASGTGTAYSWSPATGLDVTSGAVVNATPTVNTNYTVTTTLGSCSTSALVTVAVGNSPAKTPIQILNGGNDTICAGTQIILRGGPGGGGPGGGNTFTWSNGVILRNDSITPTTSGLYIVTVKSTIGCTTDDSINITVNQPANANFGYTHAGLAYTFSDSSVGAFTWNWNFGDGNFSPSQNPVHSFSTADTFDVQLIITGACGNDTMTQSIIVFDNVGINSIASENGLNVYPTPATDFITVNISNALFTGTPIMATLYNTLGEIVKAVAITKPNQTISVSNLPDGTYLLKVNMNNKQLNKLIIKK